VRISPWELHVNDPDWNEPYKVSARLNKYHWFYKFVGSSDAAFGTADHDLHRIRRKAQQTYFTLDSVARFDPDLDRISSKLVSRLQEYKGTNQPVNLSNAFRSFATDVVTEFAFDKSYNLLDSPDFAEVFHRTSREFPEIGLWHRHFGLILHVLSLMPRWLTKIINPAGIDVLDFMDDIGARTDKLVNDYKKNEKPDGRPNIIHQMLDSSTLPEADKSNWRLALEMRTLVGAGTETTGNNLTAITYHLLESPEKIKRLVEEVTEAQKKSKTPLNYQDLQQLPYLVRIQYHLHGYIDCVAN
jgi:cytochrome P450